MSELRANTVSNAAGTGPATLTGQYAAKAWLNLNGTGTIAVRESGNISSVVDNATGDYTANFASSFADANYVLMGTGDDNSASSGVLRQANATKTASACRFNTALPGTSNADALNASATFLR